MKPIDTYFKTAENLWRQGMVPDGAGIEYFEEPKPPNSINEEFSNEFEDAPIKIKCPFCKRWSDTYIVKTCDNYDTYECQNCNRLFIRKNFREG